MIGIKAELTLQFYGRSLILCNNKGKKCLNCTHNSPTWKFEVDVWPTEELHCFFGTVTILSPLNPPQESGSGSALAEGLSVASWAGSIPNVKPSIQLNLSHNRFGTFGIFPLVCCTHTTNPIIHSTIHLTVLLMKNKIKIYRKNNYSALFSFTFVVRTYQIMIVSGSQLFQFSTFPLRVVPILAPLSALLHHSMQ